MDSHFALTDLKMHDDNWPVWMLVGATAMVSLDNARSFLIGVSLQVTTCAHVCMLHGGGVHVLDKNQVESGAVDGKRLMSGLYLFAMAMLASSWIQVWLKTVGSGFHLGLGL